MGLEPQEVAMVAAHLDDLKAARGCGFKTIYVERKQEEDWKPEQEEYQDARSWVDMWVTEEEDGFLEVARRFGISRRVLKFKSTLRNYPPALLPLYHMPRSVSRTFMCLSPPYETFKLLERLGGHG